jgi:NitT/TauT family transport system substrate-binding protein
VGSATDIVYLPTTLAQRLGYYRNEGLNVRIIDTAAGSKSLEALLGGSVEVVTGFYDHTIQMAAEGRAVQAFVLLAQYPGAVALVSPEGRSRIRTIADLRKKNVGVTAPGSSSHFFLNYLLTKNGVSPDEISVIAIGGGAARVSAVERSKVDAGILYEPGVTRLMHRAPEVAILADTRTADGVRRLFGTETYPSSVLYTNRSWLEQNPDLGRRLVRAMVQTLKWISAHSAEEIAAKMPPDFQGDDPAIYVEALRNSMHMFSPDGVLKLSGAQAVRDVLAASSPKVRAANIDLSSTFTSQFLNQ